MTTEVDVLYAHPISYSTPTVADHKEACYAFLQRLVQHGLLQVDVKWAPTSERWVLLFGAKGMVPL